MIRPRWSADGPVALLAVLATALVLGLAALAWRHALPYDPFVSCETPETTFLARLGTLGLLLPVGVLAEVVLATLLAVGHQLWVTRRVLHGVFRRRAGLDTRLTRVAALAGLSGKLDLVRDEAVFTFCHGLARPRVCLSSGLVGMLDDAELLAVLRHEAHHLRFHDPVKILLSRALSSGLFFLPLARALHDAYLAAKELTADAAAASGGDDLPLARALVKMLQAQRPAWPAGVLAVGSFSPTEARLQELLDPGSVSLRLPSLTDWLVSAAIVAGIFGFSHGAAAAADVPPVQAECSTVDHAVGPPGRSIVGFPITAPITNPAAVPATASPTLRVGPAGHLPSPQ